MKHLTNAAMGGYGAKPFDPIDRDARALLADIKEHLPEVVFFQREDLLHLPCFQGVSTITRYRYVCLAVTRLLETRRLVAQGRGDLCLPRAAKDYLQEPPDVTYYKTVVGYAHIYARPFGVMDIVTSWQHRDHHITTNTKRIAVRGVLRRMEREGEIKKLTSYTWENVK